MPTRRRRWSSWHRATDFNNCSTNNSSAGSHTNICWPLHTYVHCCLPN